MSGAGLTLFLCGDVMTGRGVDQILPHPGDPRLWEPSLGDARAYVELAERANGPIPRPVDFGWPWGDALEVLEAEAPDARVINLETSVTSNDDADPDKAVHYRMSPDNVACLTVARPDVCSLANNHVLDFGHRGLADTLDALSAAEVPVAGAGRGRDDARRPVVIPCRDGGASGRVRFVAVGARSSGIPEPWAAGRDWSGVDLLSDLSDFTADAVTERVRFNASAGDVTVVSVHWGSNWGYDVPEKHVRFARRLIDGGADLVYGHSSHHPRPMEVYRDKLILYGCGDLIDDYEGIGGHEKFRDELRPLYFASVLPGSGVLVDLRVVVMRARRMRLCRAAGADIEHVREVFNRTGRFGIRFERGVDDALCLRVPR